MKFHVLILTQPERAAMLDQLLSVLLPQCDGRDVNVTVGQFDSGVSLGENRERMRQHSTGEFIAFIDDDDLVSANYVERILPELRDGIDMVGFRLQQYSDGKAERPTFNRLSYGKWFHDRTGYYRDISHVCPMRRELALAVPMEGGFGEDSRWATGLRRKGIVKTDHFIDEVLYFYLWRSCKRDDRDYMDKFRLQMIDKIRSAALVTL